MAAPVCVWMHVNGYMLTKVQCTVTCSPLDDLLSECPMSADQHLDLNVGSRAGDDQMDIFPMSLKKNATVILMLKSRASFVSISNNGRIHFPIFKQQQESIGLKGMSLDIQVVHNNNTFKLYLMTCLIKSHEITKVMGSMNICT